MNYIYIYLQMKQEGFKPGAFTYTSILNACASGTAGAMKWGKEVHIHAIEAGFGLNLWIGNATCSHVRKEQQ